MVKGGMIPPGGSFWTTRGEAARYTTKKLQPHPPAAEVVEAPARKKSTPLPEAEEPGKKAPSRQSKPRKRKKPPAKKKVPEEG